MGKATKPENVKLIIGFIFKEEPVLDRACGILEKLFGKIDFQSPILPFTYTSFYEKELGSPLRRRFISFKRLVSPQDLPKIKTITNTTEIKLSENSNRRINIDPGYVTEAKLVLATTKDYNHRIYLNRGIFAEITLFFQDKTFQSWQWTYPDYRTKEYIAVFNQIREIYACQI